MDDSRVECLNKEVNEMDCACTSTSCSRHGVCCECIRYHISVKGKPACMR